MAEESMSASGILSDGSFIANSTYDAINLKISQNQKNRNQKKCNSSNTHSKKIENKKCKRKQKNRAKQKRCNYSSTNKINKHK